jgi:hypothetical protein
VVLREISLFKFSHLTKNKGGFSFRFSSISRCLLIQPLKTTYLLKHIYMFYRKSVTERMNFDHFGFGWLMNFKDLLFLIDPRRMLPLDQCNLRFIFFGTLIPYVQAPKSKQNRFEFIWGNLQERRWQSEPYRWINFQQFCWMRSPTPACN